MHVLDSTLNMKIGEESMQIRCLNFSTFSHLFVHLSVVQQRLKQLFICDYVCLAILQYERSNAMKTVRREILVSYIKTM